MNVYNNIRDLENSFASNDCGLTLPQKTKRNNEATTEDKRIRGSSPQNTIKKS